MGRKQVKAKEQPLPDSRFQSRLVSKFINAMMLDGEKSVSQRAFYEAMDRIEEKAGQDALTIFKKAVDNVKPALEVRSRRVGGATYQVPVEVRPNRRTTLAFRWLLAAARSRSERTIAQKLASELLDAFNNQGTAIKKKLDTHRMAEANKAFAHYRW